MFQKIIGNRVVIRRGYTADKTDSGVLHIPDTAKVPLPEGTVLFVGPKATDVKPGDRVVFERFAGVDVEIPGHEEVLIMNEEHIIGVVE